MKKIKRISVFMILVLAVFTLAGCGKKFSLELPEGVTADVKNVAKIKKGKVVNLTIVVPDGKVVDKLLINEEEVDVEDNKASFKMEKDSVVNVTFREIAYYSLTIPDIITANIDDLSSILVGTQIKLIITVPEGKQIALFKVNGKSISITNNVYEFKITEDTTIEISFANAGEIIYHSLTLPNEITSNVDDETKIISGAMVRLTVNIPAGKEIEEFKLNGKNTAIVGNVYEFEITEDTTIEVTFVDIDTTVYYKLILPNYVQSNASNDNRISEGTEVVLTVNLPEINIFVDFLVDEQSVELQNNKYTLVVDKNIEVSLKYFTPANPTHIVNFIEGFDNKLLKEGTLGLDLSVNDVNFKGGAGQSVNAVIDLASNLDVKEGLIKLTTFEDINSNNIGIYLKDNIVYMSDDEYKNGVLVSTTTNSTIFDVRADSLELMLQMVFLESYIPYMPLGPTSIAHVLEQLIDHYKFEFLSSENFELLELFDLYQMDNNFKVKGKFNSVQIEPLIRLFTDNQDVIDFLTLQMPIYFEVEFEADFVDYKFEKIAAQIKLTAGSTSLDIDLELSYGDFVIESERYKYIVVEGTPLTLNFVYDDEKTVELIINEEVIDDYKASFLELLAPYKEGEFYAEYYNDPEFTIPTEYTDLVDGAIIYLKWLEMTPLEEIIDEFYFDDWFVAEIEGDTIYIESDEYIFSYYDFSSFYVYDKINNKSFNVRETNEGFKNLLIHNDFIEEKFLRDRVGVIDKYKVTYKGMYFNPIDFVYITQMNAMTIVFLDSLDMPLLSLVPGRRVYDEDNVQNNMRYYFAQVVESLDVYEEDETDGIDEGEILYVYLEDVLTKRVLEMSFEHSGYVKISFNDLIEFHEEFGMQAVVEVEEIDGEYVIMLSIFDNGIMVDKDIYPFDVPIYNKERGQALLINNKLYYINELEKLSDLTGDSSIEPEVIILDYQKFYSIEELKEYIFYGNVIVMFDVEFLYPIVP